MTYRRDEANGSLVGSVLTFEWRVFDGKDSVLREWEISNSSLFGAPKTACGLRFRFLVFEHDISRIRTWFWLIERPS